MGHSSWSDSHYSDRKAHLDASGKSAFAYTDSVMSKTSYADRKVHKDFDPKDVKFRESRDSDAHPNSRAIAVFFDVTGSMNTIPRTLQTKLPALMTLLNRKAYVTDPQVMFGGVGDAWSDRAPLQVGQFESGNEMDESLGNMFLEGGGGGSMEESYELAMYFMARHTSIDCMEKRDEKGYLFLIGDEMPYGEVSKAHVEKLIGPGLQANMSIEDVIAECSKMYEIFFLYCPSGSYKHHESEIIDRWKTLLPQRVIQLEDYDHVCEVIASTIGVNEGVVDVDGVRRDLEEVSTPDAARKATNAIVPVVAGAPGRKVAKRIASVTGKLVASSSDGGAKTL